MAIPKHAYCIGSPITRTKRVIKNILYSILLEGDMRRILFPNCMKGTKKTKEPITPS